MIKNIIFDMGQVLIKFDPVIFIERLGIDNSDDKQLLLREVYKSVEWSMIDRGTIDEEEAYKRISKRLPVHLVDKARRLIFNWYDDLILIDGQKEMLYELKENAYRLFLLSNACLSSKKYIKKIPGHELFDDIVISSEVKMVKPELAIFDFIIDRNKLKKDECLFIDDNPHNVEAAMCCGIDGVIFYDYQDLRKRLKEKGIIK